MASGLVAREASEELVEGAVLGLVVVGEQELAARGLVGAGLERLPGARRAARAGSAVTTRARTSIDRWSWGWATPNSMTSVPK